MATKGDRLDALRAENEALRRGVTLLHRVANLLRNAVEREPISYAVLTGVTAGQGLGLNRAMLFLVQGDELVGVGAVGPEDEAEADRVWRAIASEAPDLDTLYEAGLVRLAKRTALDTRVRETRVPRRAECGRSLVARALRERVPVQGRAGDDLKGLLHNTGIAAPLLGRDRVLGVLYGDNRFTGRTLDVVSQRLFALIADHAGRALENAQAYESVQELARTDALTGLPHRRALAEMLEREVTEAARTGEPLGLVMIDIDDFKAVNDTHGHPVGDALLTAIAERIRQVTRRASAYRYGGEEFTLLLSGTDREGAGRVAERVRGALGSKSFLIDGLTLQMTCSAGVASYPADATSGAALLRAADDALLRAKADGKNRVDAP